jgi:hypothetical protein
MMESIVNMTVEEELKDACSHRHPANTTHFRWSTPKKVNAKSTIQKSKRLLSPANWFSGILIQ